jgi:diaminohydroxyphosphoribosylaminopyrimidine deaminase/5-amino-6-(5-phosphoribosylamino)uracil reductase
MIVADESVRSAEDSLEAIRRLGVHVEPQPARDLPAVLSWLAGRGVLSLLVEGGPQLQTAFANAGLVDRVQRVTTPHRLGGGVPAAAIVRASTGHARVAQLGEDVLSEFDVTIGS